MSVRTTRSASRPGGPIWLIWTPRALLLLLVLSFALVTTAANAEPVSSDVSAGLAKDETPGDSVVWAKGVDNDADTLIDEDPSLNGVDEDGDGADGEDPGLDVIKSGEAQHVPVQVTFTAGDAPDELTLTLSIAGPAACNPRWIAEGEQTGVATLGSLQFGQLTSHVQLAAGEVLTFVRKYSVNCPSGTQAFNVYARAESAMGVSDPAPLNNLAENDLSLIATADVDADGVPNELDGCDWSPDPANTDADGDGIGDACDVDDDGDGFTDFAEQSIGTDPLLACGPNAWPPDLNDDGSVNIADAMAFKPYLTELLPYDSRYDLDLSESIGLPDVMSLAKFMLKSC
jgi:hypothetical protein